MSNLKEIRTRIASVSSTRKITSAMKMVSAAKFKKAQIAVFRFRPFNEQIMSILNQSIDSNNIRKNIYFTERKNVKRIVILIITSNNSMCGAFNSNIVKHAITTYNNVSGLHPNSDIVFYTLGKKGEEALKRRGYNFVPLNHSILDKPNIELSKDIFNDFSKSFLNADVDKVYLVYNRFKNAASQMQVDEQLLPILPLQKGVKQELIRPIIEPNREVLLNKLLPYYLLNKIHSAIIESIAAEHGARMTAMHQATENASSLQNQLILEYNKARQAAITKEILEIVSGANALNT